MASTHPDLGLPFAALTLGRTQPRSLLRFLREGARLGPFVRDASGLVTAFSAGVPLTGNCTVSIWRSERDMHAYAHSDRDGHGATVRGDSPILVEQLNARPRLLQIGGIWGPNTMHRDRLEQLVGLSASGAAAGSPGAALGPTSPVTNSDIKLPPMTHWPRPLPLPPAVMFSGAIGTRQAGKLSGARLSSE